MAQLSAPARERTFWNRTIGVVRSIPPIYIVAILLFFAIGLRNPTFLEASGILNFLRRAAPLMILTAGDRKSVV